MMTNQSTTQNSSGQLATSAPVCDWNAAQKTVMTEAETWMIGVQVSADEEPKFDDERHHENARSNHQPYVDSVTYQMLDSTKLPN